MSQFSIIIPLIGDRSLFEDTLASVLRYRPADCQIIVVHDGDYQDPYGLKDEVKFVVADEQNLIGYLNVALCYVSGEFTTFVRAGVELDENWSDVVARAFEDANVGAVTPIIVSRGRPSKILAAGIAADSSWTRTIVGRGRRCSKKQIAKLAPHGPSSWMGVYRTSLLKSLAPFDERLESLYIDQDIASSMRALDLRNLLEMELVGFVDEDPGIFQESQLPHGRSAQRSVARYAKKSFACLAKNFLRDVVCAPFSAWRLAHGMQRFVSRKNVAQDREHALRLKKIRLAQKAHNLEVFESSVETPVQTTYRRAA